MAERAVQMVERAIITPTEPVLEVTTTGVTNATTSSVTVAGGIIPRRHRRESFEDAVYGYIRAVRALNRTRVSSSEIASALAIPESAVLSALTALKSKGVKVAR